MRIIAAVLLLLALACQADQRPQAIEAHDTCASCRMAISQPQYAAQVVDREGTAYKFDDIGCMFRYLNNHTFPQRRLYVMDYVNRQWLEAEQAVFVRSEAIRSPMAGGLAAFRDQPAAQQFLKNSSGQMISFAELIGHEPPARQAAD